MPAGRRKRSAVEFEEFDGLGCSSGLQLELARDNESGYAGVFATSSGRWQAVARVPRAGKMAKRNVGSFDSAQEAAVHRALALNGQLEVQSQCYS